MKVLDRAAAWFGYEKKAEGRSPWDDFWYTDPQTGFRMPQSMWFGVTPDSAMRVAAVLACVRVLAETIASLPLHIYRRLPNGGKEKVPDHPLYDLLHLRPNRWQTSFDWREMLQGHLTLRGNAICEKIPGPGGTVSQLVPLNPDSFQKIELLDNGVVRYTYHQQKTGEERILHSNDVFHLRGLSSDGIVGLSVVALAADTIGLSKAAELFGSKFFSKGAKASGVLEHPENLSENALKNLRQSVAQSISGENILSPLILEEGMKWKQLSITPEDAQFLETRKFQVTDIARIFRIQPHMIGDLERATFDNIEHQSIDFVIHTIRPWLVRWEQAISRDLIADDEYFAEFLVDGLLRGDTKSRFEAYGKAITDGWMNRNEVRELENKNPRPGLDKFLVPLNMAPAGEEKEEEQGQPKIFNALFDDAAERMANAEIRTIESRIDKAAEDRDKFNKWIKSFYKSHAVYITKVLTPLSEALWDETGESLPLEAMVQELTIEGIDAFTKYDPVDSLAAWKKERKESIVIMLEEATYADSKTT